MKESLEEAKKIEVSLKEQLEKLEKINQELNDKLANQSQVLPDSYDRYKKLEVLGFGSYGIVHKVLDQNTNR